MAACDLRQPPAVRRRHPGESMGETSTVTRRAPSRVAAGETGMWARRAETPFFENGCKPLRNKELRCTTTPRGRLRSPNLGFLAPGECTKRHRTAHSEHKTAQNRHQTAPNRHGMDSDWPLWSRDRMGLATGQGAGEGNRPCPAGKAQTSASKRGRDCQSAVPSPASCAFLTKPI